MIRRLAPLVIYVGFLIVPGILSGSFTMASVLELNPGGARLNLAQSALTSFSIFCGLLLILFAEPPTQQWVGGSELRGDRRPVYLTVGLFLLYGLILVIPALRSLFELAPLAWYICLFLFGCSVLWAFLVRWLWRTQALDRYLGMES